MVVRNPAHFDSPIQGLISNLRKFEGFGVLAPYSGRMKQDMSTLQVNDDNKQTSAVQPSW